MLKKLIVMVAIPALLTSVGICSAGAEQLALERPWDERTADEYPIYRYLFVEWPYHSGKGWPNRKNALETLLAKYPNSAYADDAAFALASGKALYAGDVEGAIADLKKVAEQYPDGQLVWGDQHWCMWARNLAMLNEDGSIRKRCTFERFGHKPSSLERAVRVYFDHLERYPRYTADGAHRVIANLLAKQGRHSEAIKELRWVIDRHKEKPVTPDDLSAAKEPDGYLIKEIRRPERIAQQNLIAIYFGDLKDYQKAVEAGEEYISLYSGHPACRAIHQRTGDAYAKLEMWHKALDHYEKALQYLKEEIADFEARNPTSDSLGKDLHVAELEQLVNNAKSHIGQ